MSSRFCIFGTDPYLVIFIVLFFFLFVVNGSTAYHSKLDFFLFQTLIILSVQQTDFRIVATVTVE